MRNLNPPQQYRKRQTRADDIGKCKDKGLEPTYYFSIFSGIAAAGVTEFNSTKSRLNPWLLCLTPNFQSIRTKNLSTRFKN